MVFPQPCSSQPYRLDNPRRVTKGCPHEPRKHVAPPTLVPHKQPALEYIFSLRHPSPSPLSSPSSLHPLLAASASSLFTFSPSTFISHHQI
ncbi:hypothetical protein EX30DRAFT_254288 [Ascodesmis nigricans]|uniref:Uncharacterized protein n=1 Tax=Ascodesmis nigricans TaxID=341454 RepID=A0A4S2MYR9_9PEZI|nr:hypothetical protein EX30DRAFT_254288 [Ascodesmis nigricans]